MSGIQNCLGVCDRKVSKSHIGRDLGGRSGSGHLLRQQQLRPLAPGEEKLQAEASTAVLKAGRDVQSIILMSEKEKVTGSGKGDHCVCFCAHSMAL